LIPDDFKELSIHFCIPGCVRVSFVEPEKFIKLYADCKKEGQSF